MTIVDFIASLTASAAATVNLTRPQMQELQVLLDEPRENFPYLDRVRGVLNGCPLTRDREVFEELCGLLLRRYRLKELVNRLRSEVERQGGLLSPQDARIAYAMTQRASSTVH